MTMQDSDNLPPAPPPGPPSGGQPLARPWWRQRKWLAAAAAGTAVVVVAVVAVLLAASGPGNFTAHGSETVCGDLLGGSSATDSYPDVTDGTQVTVIDSANHVIGTGALSETNTTTLENDFAFTVRVPGGEPRYGVQVGQNRGTVWFSEKQMRKGPGVSLGC